MVTVDELIVDCLALDNDIESLNRWNRLYHDPKTDSYYKLRTYDVRYSYQSIQKELEGTGLYLNAILDLDFCFPHYKKVRCHLYRLVKNPGDLTIITYKGDWNKNVKQVMKSPEFKRMALTREQRDYFDNVLNVWLEGRIPAENPSLFRMETKDGRSIISLDRNKKASEEDKIEENAPEATPDSSPAEPLDRSEGEELQKDAENDDPYQTGCRFYYDEKDVQKAVYYFTDAANNGDMDAQYILGTIYYRGELGTVDYKKAFQYFEMAAEQNDPDSENWLAWMYYNGYGVEKDIDMAIRWYEVAAKEGLADAQYSYGCLYHMEDNPKRDNNKALKWLKRAKKRGDRRADLLMNIIKSSMSAGNKEDESEDDYAEDELQSKYKTAVDYLKGSTDDLGIKTAIGYLTETSAAGHGPSQMELGLLYMKGEHVEKDIEKAKEYLTQAFNNGVMLAGIHLATLYLESSDPKDIEYGADLLKGAREKGSSLAAMKLARMYLSGDKIPKDVDLAISIFKELADKKNSEAQLQLGLIYYRGDEFVSKDMAQAISWFVRSANNNNPVAMEYLGAIYLDSKSVMRKTDKAKNWFEKAKKNGGKNADAYIGWMKYKGIEYDLDYEGAEQSLISSAEFGNTMAMETLGDLYLTAAWDKYDPESAVKWYTAAAERGRTNCFIKLGKLFMEGEHVESDVNEGILWFEKAMNEGQTEAYSALGDIYFEGSGIPQDFAQAARYYQLGSDKGDRKSRMMLSKMYGEGIYFSKDEAKAAELSGSLVLSDPETIYQSAIRYRIGDGVDMDRDKEIELLTEAAHKGHMLAQYEIGQLFQAGDLLPNDTELAEKYILMSANQGYPPAEYHMYNLMKKRDIPTAMEWLWRSAEHGYPPAMIKYAKLLTKKTKGIDMDIPRAIELLERMVDAGNNEALATLARIHLYNEDYIDIDKGLRLLNAGAENGDKDCLLELGDLYLAGRFVDADLDMAMKCFTSANSASGYMKMFREYSKRDMDLDEDKAFDCILKAAELGNANAMFQVKQICIDKGLKSEYNAKAFECFQKMALDGDKRAQGMLAQCYMAGRGVERDKEKAEEWFLEAIKDNSITSDVRMFHRQLATMYKKDKTEESMKSAFEHYLKAAELGDSLSIIIIANYYLKGEYIERDLEKVKYWVEMAEKCKQKPDIVEAIEKIRLQMDEIMMSEMKDE